MAHLYSPDEIKRRKEERARRDAERPRRLEVNLSGCEIPDYDSGKIVCFKSDSLMNMNLPPSNSKAKKSLFSTRKVNPPPADSADYTNIGLMNSVDELILEISIRRQQGVIIFNSRASRTLHHGWGPEEVVKLERYSSDISLSDRILVHDLGDRFQIIFGFTTVHYFIKRFKNGTPMKACYSTNWQYTDDGSQMLMSSILYLSVFNLSDLPMYEAERIEAHWKSSSADSGGVLSPTSLESRTCPLTTLSWDSGKEIRLYHLGPRNVLQESVYSEREKTNKWYSGDLQKLQVVLGLKSSIAAIQWQEEIRLYYQDQNSDVIRELRKASRTASWAQGTIDLRSVKNSSIAAVWLDNGSGSKHIHIYYQDPELYFRVYCEGRASRSAPWTHGLFKHGPHPPGTSITAEVLQGRQGSVRVSLSWKDTQSELVVNTLHEISSQPTTLNRNHPPGHEDAVLDGRG